MLFINFLADIYSSRRLLLNLAKDDFKSRYMGNHLGMLWAFIQPLVTIAVLWFVFTVGFRAAASDGVPFILWLITGMIPWFFFSEALQNSTNAILSNSFLVKKVVFRVSLLPIVQVTSSSLIHLFFVGVIVLLFFIYGYTPSIYWLQVFYYFGFTVILVLGISWITSAVVVFLRDLGQLIGVIIQLGFWLTPIFWNIGMVPEKYQYLIKLNPVYYIIQGYRDSFIYHVGFWEKPLLSIYNLVIVMIFLLIGSVVFKRLRPHFADVL